VAKTVGIYGGSFNPVHTGHLIVASYIAQWGNVDEVWLMLSPLNPFKAKDKSLADTAVRERMLRLAAEGSHCLRICDEQLSMPVPSYTIDTLDALAAKHPGTHFRCIIGSDSWAGFSGWKEAGRIISSYGVIIYPRPGYPVDAAQLPRGVTVVDAPTVEISSTFIRNAVAEGKDISYFVPAAVAEFISSTHLYSNDYANQTDK
jgi:nicotinate-nucleotide adenylyltransferase